MKCLAVELSFCDLTIIGSDKALGNSFMRPDPVFIFERHSLFTVYLTFLLFMCFLVMVKALFSFFSFASPWL